MLNFKIAMALSRVLESYQAPAKAGADPPTQITYRGLARATGAIYAADKTLIFGNNFRGVLMIVHLSKFVYSFFLMI